MLVGDTCLPSRSRGMKHPLKQTKVAIIREEFVALTGECGPAVVLNQLLYWTQRVEDFDELLEEEISYNPGSNVQPRYGWIYKSASELTQETILGVSEPTIHKYLNLLISKGWLEKRDNPHTRWNKTKQYRLNLHQLHEDLLEIGYDLLGYPPPQNLKNKGFDEDERGKAQHLTSDLKNLSSNERNLTPRHEKLKLNITETTSEITQESSLHAREDNFLAEELLDLWKESTHQVNIPLQRQEGVFF